MTDDQPQRLPLHTMGRESGARAMLRAATTYLRNAGHGDAAQLLDDDATAITQIALNNQPRDNWKGAYAGAEARADQAARDRHRAERRRSGGFTEDDDG